MSPFSKKLLKIMSVIILFFVFIAAGDETRGLKIVVKNKENKPEEIKVYDRVFGLVIGIDNFVNLKPTEQLNNCVNDAKGVKEVLDKNYNFDKIYTLFNKDATKQGVLNKFSEINKNMSSDDALFVFIASHGITFKTNDIETGFIVPSDGSFDENEAFKNISMIEFKDVIGNMMKAKHIFYVFDACYSGSILTRGGQSEFKKKDFDYIKEMTKEKVRYALTAGDKGQTVLDGGANGHSVFTWRLIEFLENATDFLTSSELSENISMKVFSDAKDKNHKQTPMYGRLSGLGNFVFMKKNMGSLDSVEKDLEVIAKEKSALQKELDNLKSSAANKDEQNRIALELQRKKAEEEKKKLELESLQEIETKKTAERKRSEEISAEYEKNQKKQNSVIEKINKENADKLKIIEEMNKLENNFESIVKQLTETEKIINEIKSNYEDSRKKALNENAEFYKQKNESVNLMIKDIWETQEEFNNRKKNDLLAFRKNEYDASENINKNYDEQIAKNTKELNKKCDELLTKRFSLTGKDVKVEVGEYDDKDESFPFKITSDTKNILYTYSFNISIKSASSTERKEKFLKINNTAKANGYVGEISFMIKKSNDLKLSDSAYSPFVLSSRVIDITDGNKEIFSVKTKEEEEFRLAEETRKQKRLQQVKEEDQRTALLKDYRGKLDNFQKEKTNILNTNKYLKIAGAVSLSIGGASLTSCGISFGLQGYYNGLYRTSSTNYTSATNATIITAEYKNMTDYSAASNGLMVSGITNSVTGGLLAITGIILLAIQPNVKYYDNQIDDYKKMIEKLETVNNVLSKIDLDVNYNNDKIGVSFGVRF